MSQKPLRWVKFRSCMAHGEVGKGPGWLSLDIQGVAVPVSPCNSKMVAVVLRALADELDKDAE